MNPGSVEQNRREIVTLHSVINKYRTAIVSDNMDPSRPEFVLPTFIANVFYCNSWGHNKCLKTLLFNLEYTELLLVCVSEP